MDKYTTQKLEELEKKMGEVLYFDSRDRDILMKYVNEVDNNGYGKDADAVLIAYGTGFLGIIEDRNKSVEKLMRQISCLENDLHDERYDKTAIKARLQFLKENGCSFEQLKAFAIFEFETKIAKADETINDAYGVNLVMACAGWRKLRSTKNKIEKATTVDEILSIL